MTVILAVLLVAGLAVCVCWARRESVRARDTEIARGLATMRYRPEHGEADILAGRWREP